MRGTASIGPALCAAVALLLLAGCDGPPEVSGDDCGVGDLAGPCEDRFCVAPSVEVGTGSRGFEPVEPGQPIPIYFGPQGGYHVDVAFQMRNLCDIVWVQYTLLYLPDGGGEAVEVASANRHIQAVRAEDGLTQSIWGLRGFIPCWHWPEDPWPDVACPEVAGSAGPLNHGDLVLQVKAWDDVEQTGHPDRMAFDEVQLDPWCCEYPWRFRKAVRSELPPPVQ